MPSLCCGSFALLGLLMPDEDNAARVDCGTPGPGGVDCAVARTSGTGSLEACWDLEITCENKGVMTGHACGAINAGKNSAKVNMPVADFSNQEACDAPKSGAVVNLSVRTVE